IVSTPPLASPLPGITRATAVALLEEIGCPLREEPVTRDSIYIADEVFMTGTAAEITPVRELDGRVIGEGKPGPVTVRLQRLYEDVTRRRHGLERRWGAVGCASSVR